MGLRGEGPVLVGVLWMEIVITLIVVALRIYTRTVIRNNVGWDDALLVVTWGLMVGFVALCTASAMYGMGVHVDQLNHHQQTQGKLLLLLGQTVISLAMGTSKCAVSVFLMRIVVKRWHMAFLWFWTASIMFLGIFQAISVMTQCTPSRSLWDTNVTAKSCPLDLVTISYVICSWSAILDFVLAIFPWYALWGLNMKFKEKVNICLSLSLGIIAGVCGVVRTTGLNALAVSDDYLYAVTESAIWTNSEITLTMVCVSIPALRPLCRSLAGRSTSNETSNYNQINPYHLQKYSGQTSHPDYALDSLTTTTVHGKQGTCDNSATSKHTGIDEGSDDMDTSHILNNQNYDPNVIHQITEVDISYEDRKSDVPTVPAKARQHI